MAMEVEEYPRHDEKNELAAWNTDTWFTFINDQKLTLFCAKCFEVNILYITLLLSLLYTVENDYVNI